MTREELRTAVNNARNDVAELRAKKDLESAVSKLKTIIEQYPKSTAAQEAKKLLEATKSPVGEADSFRDGLDDSSADGDAFAPRNADQGRKAENGDADPDSIQTPNRLDSDSN